VTDQVVSLLPKYLPKNLDDLIYEKLGRIIPVNLRKCLRKTVQFKILLP
jgi:hypothetical protein